MILSFDAQVQNPPARLVDGAHAFADDDAIFRGHVFFE